jgi:hypothetical protein
LLKNNKNIFWRKSALSKYFGRGGSRTAPTIGFYGLVFLLVISNTFAQNNSFIITNTRVFDGEEVHPKTNVLVEVVWVGNTAVPNSDDTSSPEKLALILNNLTPLNWVIYNQVRHFIPENLYERINGRAEYYISYDVVGLTFASFEKITDPNTFINVSVYDMGSPLNAFGVFSGERSPKTQRLDLGRDSYASGSNYYIWHGQYYIQIVAFKMTEELKSVGWKIAGQLTDQLED